MAGKSMKWCATHGRYIARKANDPCPDCELKRLEEAKIRQAENLEQTGSKLDEFSLDNISFGASSDK